jgi:uncharacterized membrane protein YeiB
MLEYMKMNSPLSARIAGLDIARGVAVIGMLGAHTVGGVDPVTDLVVHGKPSVLFYLLAGVTIGLTATRRGDDDDQTAARRRVRVLIRAGAVLGIGGAMLLIGLQSVLPVHAVLMTLLGTLLFVRSRTLVAIGVGMLLVLPQVTVLSGSGFDFGGALDSAPSQLQGMLAVLLPAGAYSAASVAGLLLGRLLVAGKLRPSWLALGGASAAVLAYGTSGVAAALGVRSPFLSGVGHAGSSVEILGSIGVAAVVLAAALALPRRAAVLLSPVAAIGRLALTMYVLHFVFAIAALALLGTSTLALWTAFAISTAALAAVAVLVTRRFRHGPLEWVVATAADRLTATPARIRRAELAAPTA